MRLSKLFKGVIGAGIIYILIEVVFAQGKGYALGTVFAYQDSMTLREMEQLSNSDESNDLLTKLMLKKAKHQKQRVKDKM